MSIREAGKQDWPAIWPIFHEVVSAGDTYAFEIDTTQQQAEKIWLQAPRRTFLFESHDEVLGTYYLKTNQAGPGKHVRNCGYMVSSKARGRGVATDMCEHSQGAALALGYKAMQFNFVAASNARAIRLRRQLGFDVAGQLPKAFHHPTEGFVDALVMFKWLENS